MPLRDGDALRFGSVAMVFHRSEAGAPTETATRRRGSEPRMTLSAGARIGSYEIVSSSARAGWERCTSPGTSGSAAKSP